MLNLPFPFLNANEYMSSLSDLTKIVLMTLSIILSLWCYDLASENARTTINHIHSATFLSKFINVTLFRSITFIGMLFIVYLFWDLTNKPTRNSLHSQATNTSNQIQTNYIQQPLYHRPSYKRNISSISSMPKRCVSAPPCLNTLLLRKTQSITNTTPTIIQPTIIPPTIIETSSTPLPTPPS